MLATHHQMLTRVCTSLQQLTDNPDVSRIADGADTLPFLNGFWIGQAGSVGSLLLRALTRIAVDADRLAAVLSHKILLADSVPAARIPGQPVRHFTLRCVSQQVVEGLCACMPFKMIPCSERCCLVNRHTQPPALSLPAWASHVVKQAASL
jgi:hypothetical protein